LPQAVLEISLVFGQLIGLTDQAVELLGRILLLHPV
jgi:hypothetical protein